MVPTTTKKKRKHPYGGKCIPSSNHRFSQVGGNRVSEAPEVVFDLTQRDEGKKTPSRPSYGPTGLFNDCKGSGADGSHKRSQTAPG